MNSAILVQNKTLQTTLRVQYYSTSWPMPTWNTFEYLQACLCPCANTHFWAYTMIWYPKNCTKLNSVQNDENYNKLYKECTSSIMFKCGRLSSRYHQDHLVSISQFLPNSHYCTHKKFSFHFSFLLLLQQSNLLSSLNLSSKVQLRRNRFGSINYQKTSFPRRCQKKLQKNWTYCRFFFKSITNNLLGHSTSFCHASSYKREAKFTSNNEEKERTKWEKLHTANLPFLVAWNPSILRQIFQPFY